MTAPSPDQVLRTFLSFGGARTNWWVTKLRQESNLSYSYGMRKSENYQINMKKKRRKKIRISIK